MLMAMAFKGLEYLTDGIYRPGRLGDFSRADQLN
jgi:hypothetical protein